MEENFELKLSCLGTAVRAFPWNQAVSESSVCWDILPPFTYHRIRVLHYIFLLLWYVVIFCQLNFKI